VARRFLTTDDLTGLLAEHRPARRLSRLDRLTGGSKKGVYRLVLDDGSTLILYVWNAAENYWPASPDAADDPFTDANGAELFRAAHAALVAAGARVPHVYAFDRTRRHHPADLALVEDVRGGSLETLMAGDPHAAAAPLALLGDSLRAMHSRRGRRIGKVAHVEDGAATERVPEDVAAARALRHLDAVAVRDPRVAAVRHQLEELVRASRAAVSARHEHVLVHGELGPDHVLLDGAGHPVIVDIEGLTYFDVEWEHAFLRRRFGPDAYARLRLSEVDEARVDLYRLAQTLSLIEGPLRIADTDYPDRDWMLNLAEWNIQDLLAAVDRSP
jgi:aminoglycoside phosphotransferase (APT) family kinase protein